MSQQTTDPAPGSRLGIDWRGTVAGALAAVSSAVLLSTLGAAGTLIGAALGSVIVTVASAFYKQGLENSHRKLARAPEIARQKVGVAQAEVRRASRADDTRVQESHLEYADERLAEAHEELDALAGENVAPGWRERLAALPFKRLALAAAALFAVAVLLITAFELVSGRTVSSYTGGSGSGGTTVSDLGGGGKDTGKPEEGTSPTPSDAASPSDEPTEAATPGETGSPTPTGEPTATEAPTPSGAPTETLGSVVPTP